MDAIWIGGIVVVAVLAWLVLRDSGPKTPGDLAKHAAGKSADDLAAEIEVFIAYGRDNQARGLANAARRRFPDDPRFSA